MIISDFMKAIEQLSDPRFRRVLLLGIGLTVLLLAAIYAAFMFVLSIFIPESFTLPWIGTIHWVDELISWASIPLMLLLSAFLMVPVASAFTALFLDEVADAVEDQHYPDLSQAPRAPFITGLIDSVKFLGVIVVANIAALLLYIFFIPLAPFIFWALNGFLLGREYFQLVALRRLPPAEARAMRKQYTVAIWIAGALMAIPLSFPIINLLVPVLGAATFTHLFHRLQRDPPKDGMGVL
jgi:uncharacterized protein involved in cysteine biosynthesis